LAWDASNDATVYSALGLESLEFSDSSAESSIAAGSMSSSRGGLATSERHGRERYKCVYTCRGRHARWRK
jgi:hypothetical protein